MNRDSRLTQLETLAAQADGDNKKMTYAIAEHDGDAYRYNDQTVTREADETEGEFYRRACDVFGSDELIGLIGLKPDEIARTEDGGIDCAACSTPALKALLDANARASATRSR